MKPFLALACAFVLLVPGCTPVPVASGYWLCWPAWPLPDLPPILAEIR